MAHATRKPAGDKGTADRIEADDGHVWVRLVTKQALDREGSSMGHCVGGGGYDLLAGSEDMADSAIWSLRRPDGISVLTVAVEALASEHRLSYAKGPKNSPPGRFEAMQVAHLAAAFEDALHSFSVYEGTQIVLMEDGRSYREDRLPPEAVAAREAVQRARRVALAERLARQSPPDQPFPWAEILQGAAVKAEPPS
ncbi:hypothetical protein [Methylobacterium sp. 22177]|uniref:hypothetical protein n=1 Tax=Methylobacterium sp. 22177 TaxID=3453885 RepID=UPI003F8399E5